MSSLRVHTGGNQQVFTIFTADGKSRMFVRLERGLFHLPEPSRKRYHVLYGGVEGGHEDLWKDKHFDRFPSFL